MQAKVEPASLAVNEKLATVAVVLVGGRTVIEVSGGVVSRAGRCHQLKPTLAVRAGLSPRTLRLEP